MILDEAAYTPHETYNYNNVIENFNPTSKRQYFMLFCNKETSDRFFLSPDFVKNDIEKKWAGCEIAEFLEKQNELPLILEKSGYSNDIFMFKNFVYYVRDEFFESLEDLKALILANELKWHKKIERAKAITKKPQNFDNHLTIPDDVKMFVWRRDEGKCVKCGSHKNLEFDHIIPISKGGSNTSRNIQILCEKCNREKGDNIA